MPHISTTLVLLAIILKYVEKVSTTPRYNCSTNRNHSCALSHIILSRDSPQFIPISHNSSFILEVSVSLSSIPVLTSDICNTFHNIKTLDLDKNSIEFITNNAFHDCAQLKNLHLENNLIVEIKPSTFKYNTALSNLQIQNNRLSRIENGLFKYTTELRFLNLDRNNLTCISKMVIRSWENIEILSLEHNQLLDVNLEEIVHYMKELKMLKINGNNFYCERLQQIIELKKDSRIFIDLLQKTTTGDGLDCLERDEWERKLNSLTVDCDKIELLDYVKDVVFLVLVSGSLRIIIVYFRRTW